MPRNEKRTKVVQASLIVNGVTYPLDMKEKEFKTGSRGFYVWGKAYAGDTPYQMSGNLVEIGSKPRVAPAPPS